MKTAWLVPVVLACSCAGGSGSDLGPADGKETELSQTPCHLDLDLAVVSTIDADPGTGVHAAAATDGQGRVWIAYADVADGIIRLARKTGPDWEIERVLEGEARIDGTWFGRSLALGVLPGDVPLLVFYDADERILKAATLGDAGWNLEVIDQKQGAGLDVSMSIADGIAHIAYLDLLDGDLMYAVGKTGDWSRSAVDTEGIGGNDPSLALWGGTVHISYYHCGELVAGGCTGQLRFAAAVAGGFEVEVVDQGDDTGWYTALAFDDTGRPHISYFSHDSGRLKYATKVNGQWVTEVADPGPTTGEFSAIAALGDQVFIACTDRTSQSLRIVERLPDGSWKSRDLDGPGTFAAFTPLGDCGLACAWHDEGAGDFKYAELTAN